MRPVIYFPELRLGDHAFPAHAAYTLAAVQHEQGATAEGREALRAKAAEQPRPIRRRVELKSCVIEV